MLRVVPHFAAQLGVGDDRTRAQLVRMGVPAGPSTLRATVALRVPAGVTPARRLCASALIDYLVRLDPLIGAVLVDADDPHGLIGDLPERFPVRVEECATIGEADVVVSIGALRSGCDLVLDAAGWVSGVGDLVRSSDDGNPIGALATAALGTGEIFKFLFQRALPHLSFTRRLEAHRGIFSFYSYQYDQRSPALPRVSIDAILVGAGGVGAGVLVALAHLGSRVSGTLVVIDDDKLDLTNLNRVTYATRVAARSQGLKVDVAARYIARHAPALTLVPVPETYRAFAQRIPRRVDRRYPLVVTALDDDDVRWQVQRDLPRTLVDAATGIEANCRVERVRFGQQGCIGCSRPPGPGRAQAVPGEQCDAAPDPHAPSISFLSGFAGTLAAAEVIKLAIAPEDALEGYFEHMFLYPLNPEQRGLPALRTDCRVDCGAVSVRKAYNDKWPNPDEHA